MGRTVVQLVVTSSRVSAHTTRQPDGCGGAGDLHRGGEAPCGRLAVARGQAVRPQQHQHECEPNQLRIGLLAILFLAIVVEISCSVAL